MCGVLGFYYKTSPLDSKDFVDKETQLCSQMLSKLRLRGPDEQSVTVFGNAVLGHSRLSIIDLNTGSQPVYNEDNTIAVILNGEIYNFKKLRKELILKGHQFRTSSDTEVLVHLYEEFGEGFFSRLNGMFAILLHDKKENVFLVARDRMGEKPLLYWDSEQKIIFASELKALLRHPEIPAELDADALALYFNSMYVPAPCSIISGVKKIPPAHYMKLKGQKKSMVKYWDPRIQVNWSFSENEITEQFIELFSDAVLIRKVADVPIGIFLSGGIDSSAVTAIMAHHSKEQIKTFSVGFADEVDERPYARVVATKYSTDHTEIYIDDKIEDVVLDVLAYYDEPFGDSSAIPTYLVAREARKYVKVVLTGDGGDELFAGYGSYLDQRYLRGGRYSTRIFKELNRFALQKFGFKGFDGIYSRDGSPGAWDYWHRIRTILSAGEIKAFASGYDVDFAKFYAENTWLNLKDKDPLTLAFGHDLNFYLPDDLLKKVDMASMKTSLECRAPFLDHRLVEFAMSIPPHQKVRQEQLKYFLKSGLKGYLPDEILYRKKTGFGAPVASWLNYQLKEMACDLLKPGCRCENYVDRESVITLMTSFYEHKNQSDFRLPLKLWLLFVLELWLKNYLPE